MKVEREQGTEFNLLVLPGPSKLDSQAVMDQLPDLKPFRFASPEEMIDCCQLTPGSMPPFADSVFPQLDHLFVDESLLSYQWIGFNAAALERSIVVRSQDYLRVAAPSAILHFAAR
jgi:prolyl-tRNA editing enzyme YbaK/EbsC (Cys-tRNA(Pro) deacylase)